VAFLNRALTVVETKIVPKTIEGVRGRSGLFGAAVLDKSDPSIVIIGTKTEAENPLLHGEIQTVNAVTTRRKISVFQCGPRHASRRNLGFKLAVYSHLYSNLYRVRPTSAS
jgi:tRNA(Arg) A34 adenosine deaminase TadA